MILPEVKYDHKSIQNDSTEAHNDIEHGDDADNSHAWPGESGPGAGDHRGQGWIYTMALQRGGLQALGHTTHCMQAGVLQGQQLWARV